jgi:hypothetical protein
MASQEQNFFLVPKHSSLPEQIDFFFAAPLPVLTSWQQSPLYLMRREMQDCLIGTVVEEDAILAYTGKRHRLFATVMVIMSGIDLLAKFHAGSDEKGEVHDRFTAFVAAFMFDGRPSAADYPDVLYYGCRNPVLHSFSFHQEDYRINVIDRWPHSEGPVRHGHGDRHFVINVEALVQAFVKTVRGYEAAVRRRGDLQEKFTKMFPTYGSIGVQSFDDTVRR